MSFTTNKLTVGYPGKPVLQDLSITFRHGETVCMLGRNGCGKSTLLRTLAGLQPALSGSWSLQNLSANEKARYISLVLTGARALSQATIMDVVAMGRYPYTDFLGKLNDKDKDIVYNALISVGIPPKGNNDIRSWSAQTKLTNLSDGERQRILIAKALAQETPIILLDEPTAFLDLPNRILVLQLLQELAHQQGKTVILSTHELSLAIHYADRILLIGEGTIELDTPQNLLQKDAFTHAFGIDLHNIGTE